MPYYIKVVDCCDDCPYGEFESSEDSPLVCIALENYPECPEQGVRDDCPLPTQLGE